VLVVGAGLSGSMVAHKIRKLHPTIHLAVWECAKGSAGKHASRRFGSEVCDLGGQVFTVVGGNDLAQQEISMLCQAGVTRPAKGLQETETRGQCQNPTYYHSAGSKVMRWYLEQARPNDLRFNRRVTRVDRASGRHKWQVTSVDGEVSDPFGPQTSFEAPIEDFDSVVICGDAGDALKIVQSGHVANAAVQQYLGSVSYNTRLCYGFVFDDRLNQYFDRFFRGGQAPEIKVDNEVIHMVYSMAVKNNSSIGSVTVHCTRQFTESLMQRNSGDIRKDGMNQVMSSLASVLGCSPQELESGLKHFDGVHWRRCQATPPPVPQDPSFTRYPGCCVIASHRAASLVVCGDHMVGLCCFTGVVMTTTAGAEAAVHEIRGTNLQVPFSIHQEWGPQRQLTQGPPPVQRSGGGPSVLVVGAGLSGSMIASKIRKMHPQIHLAVWEAARGAAGKHSSRRFGEGQKETCDLGGQVFTVVNGDQLAQQEIDMLCQAGVCRLSKGLEETETRGQCQNPTYYHSAGSKVMRWYLDKAQPNDLRFNRRVMRLENHGQKWQVHSNEGDVSDPVAPQMSKPAQPEEFDCVVICGDAQDALSIAQSTHVVSRDVQLYLASVSYDSRLMLGFVFDERLNQYFERFFRGGQQAEVKVDNGVIHMVYSMAVKNRSSIGAITVHCTRHFTDSLTKNNPGDIRKEGMTHVMLSLSQLLGCSKQELESGLRHYDGVHWRRCQATAPPVPMQDPAFSRNPGCAVISTSPGLVICGDHMVGQCCFTGVVKTTTAGASAIADSMHNTRAGAPASPMGAAWGNQSWESPYYNSPRTHFSPPGSGMGMQGNPQSMGGLMGGNPQSHMGGMGMQGNMGMGGVGNGIGGGMTGSIFNSDPGPMRKDNFSNSVQMQPAGWGSPMHSPRYDSNWQSLPGVPF
jgi:predicted NAD/FAD-dependent oxidoreductase